MHTPDAAAGSGAEPDRLRLDIAAQPDDTTCGPTCLHGIYRFYGDAVALEELIQGIPSLETGGTLAVHLGIHALRRGYRARLYTFNLEVFDPTWFALPAEQLPEKIEASRVFKRKYKTRHAMDAYLEFLKLGGEIRMKDLSSRLLRKYLSRGIPILTGLSASYLYQSMREIPETCADDDLRGEPAGHFVVLTGYDREQRLAWVADPYSNNPLNRSQYYAVPLERLITAILLGVLTYDANLLLITQTKAEIQPSHS